MVNAAWNQIKLSYDCKKVTVYVVRENEKKNYTLWVLLEKKIEAAWLIIHIMFLLFQKVWYLPTFTNYKNSNLLNYQPDL